MVFYQLILRFFFFSYSIGLEDFLLGIRFLNTLYLIEFLHSIEFASKEEDNYDVMSSFNHGT